MISPMNLVSRCVRRKLLTGAGVQHDPDAGTESLRRDVVAELRPNDTRVAVRTSDLAPDDADLGSSLLGLGAVDVGDTLAEVELGVLLVLDTLNLDERGVRVRVVLASLVALDPALRVESSLYANKTGLSASITPFSQVAPLVFHS